MATTVKGPKPSQESELSALRQALVVERKGRYSDFQGKHSTFSQFMRRTADRLCRRHPEDAVWTTVRGFFSQYPNQDVATRISIVHRVEELLQPYWRVEEEEKAQADACASNAVDETDPAHPVHPSASHPPESVRLSHSTDSRLYKGPAAGDVGGAKGTSSSADSRLYKGHAAGDVGGAKGTSQPTDSRAAQPTDSRLYKGHAAGDVGSAKGTSQPTDSRAPQPTDSRSSKPAPPGNQTPAAARGKELPHAQSIIKPNRPNLTQDPDELPIQYIKGVGPRGAAVLAKLGIEHLRDLLRHYPRRHLDFNNHQRIRDLQEGQEVTVYGEIKSVGAFQSKRGNVSIISILISDGTGSITVTRFVGGRSNKYLMDRYKGQYPKGAQVLASGITERDDYTRRLTLKNAEIELLGRGGGGGDEAEEPDQLLSNSIHAGRLVPVYPLTEGISLRQLRNIMYAALESIGTIPDYLPESIKNEYDLAELDWSLRTIHFPDDLESKDRARHRLVFDELFGVQLQLAHRRYNFEKAENALSIPLIENGLVDRLRQSLPFKLTGAQDRVFNQIARDLSSPKPLHRLVQGDVGSGKTVVALMSALVAIENGFQCAVMAPTEILAEQHYRQFQKLLTPLGLRCCLVVGKQGTKERRQVRQELFTGQIHIAVGTHALLEDEVEFNNLGLIVIDEQHRFGVKQRARLKAKSQSPELLTMTATPIPRTLALTIHGDLDVSEIDEMPPGRKPIITKLCRPGQKNGVWDFILEQVAIGRQAYVVFPLIEESETLSAKAATIEFAKLTEKYQGQLRIGLMHGKLKPQEKDEVMESFRNHEFDILVCTTVIEVGVDVPNASVMVIENADRFGLSALHQLRGRVGRGADQSYCFLVSESRADATRQRLEILTQTNDGFVVAQKDLEIRGPGEFLGFRQSGLPELVLADLVKDAKVLEEARHAAIALIKDDPELEKHKELRKLLTQKATSEEVEIMRSG